MNKKNIGIIAFIVAVIVIAGIIAYSGGYFSAVTTSTFVKPLWARLECLPDDSYSGSSSLISNSAEVLVKCGIEEFTDECRIKVSVDNVGPIDDEVSYRLCDSTGNNCGAIIRKTIATGWTGAGKASINLDNLEKGQSYKIVTYDNIAGFMAGLLEKQSYVDKTYKPWGLYDFFGGGKRVVNSANCNVPTYDNGVLTATNIPMGEKKEVLFMTGGEGLKWINYVHDWAYGPGTNVFTHSTYGQVYCTGARLYSIVKVTTADGKIRTLEPTYVGTANDGTVYNGLGSYLGSVQCCPSSYNCGSNFQWTVPEGHSCNTDIDCRGGGAEVCSSATSLNQDRCIANKCTAQTPKTVQCCNNAACTDGKICDLAVGLTQYTCINSGGTHYCGDGVCDADETTTSCNSDCNVPPKEKDWLMYIVIGLLILVLIVIIATQPVTKKK